MANVLQRNNVGRAVVLSVLFALGVCGTAWAQDTVQVSGTVTSTGTAEKLWGVTVRVRGGAGRTVTDQQGRYAIAAPANGILTYGLIGFRGKEEAVGARTTIDVTLDQAPTVLEEVVVTGYQTQRRGDITGAVASVNVENAQKQTSASVLQRLDGRVSGVTVENSGSPGSRSTVRVRGISSFQNNDPLYIIDGTPVDGTSDSYINWLNPSDIDQIQVLKDASAASIYGSRASNGVVIIETKKGRNGGRQIRLDVRSGVATPTRGYNDFMIQKPLDYFEVVRRSYINDGKDPSDTIPTAYKILYGDPNNPRVPLYTYVADTAVLTRDIWGRPTSVDTSLYSFPSTLIMPGSPGTDWWKAVFSPAQVTDANLGISGGGADNSYNVSFNYLKQDGTAAYNSFQRGTVRVNTAFNVGRWTVGENLALSREQHFGGIPDDPGGYAEDGIMGKDILMQPVVPIFDIAGNFASGKGTNENQSNPLKWAFARKDDKNTTDRAFGNVFAGLDVIPHLAFRTRFGFNLGQNSNSAFNPTTPEDLEPQTTNGITENLSRSTDWTFTNTLNYGRTMGKHNLTVLLGQEANQNNYHLITGSIGSLINTDVPSRYIQDALGSASSKNVSSTGSVDRLLSFFGKADYNYEERYYVSGTLRRDGSSKFGPGHQWGNFPAFNVGWRLSRESFFPSDGFFSNAMLRLGWGKTGNQRIPGGRIVAQFGGDRGDTFYDIAGSGSTVQPGFRQTKLGNADLKWEENTSTNVGVDLEFLRGRGNFTIDIYQRSTDNLLFDPPNPATGGLTSPAIVNIGKMENRGIDFSISYSGAIGVGKSWSASFNASHYKNKIVRIDGDHDSFFGPITTRYASQGQVINKLGYPIGSFYGLVAEGMFRDSADVANHAVQGNGAKPGQIKFRDINGDGIITQADQTIIGSPHPDVTAGLDLGFRMGSWDFSATFFGSFGNKIWDVQKEFYVFRLFNTNVRQDVLTDSWTPTNLNAKYPALDVSDAFSRQPSSFYLENGSYVRLRNLQIGYTVPPSLARWLPAGRIFVQAENLLTITGYPGLDPALPAANVTGPAGDIRDQYRGIDRGSYPSNRTISFGISTTF